MKKREFVELMERLREYKRKTLRKALQTIVRYLQKQLYGASSETLEALGLQMEKREA